MNPADQECHKHCHRKAEAFGVVAAITRLMEDAADRMQHWRAETTATFDAAGRKNGGYEIRISIAPPGAEAPPAG